MINKLLFPLMLCLLFGWAAQAQISLGGIPKSIELGLDDTGIDEVRLPAVDVKALLDEDAINALNNNPYRFAFPFKVSYNLNNIGEWTTLDNGDRIWRLQISCSEALSVNLLYDDFYIPPGGLYFIYSEDRSQVLGAFGAHNNRPSRKFATGLVESTSIILEYFEPAAVTGQGSISVGQVSHGYRGFEQGNEGLNDAGPCQVNINCSPEGDNWQIEKKSVARIVINGIETCTGTLINNIAQNCTPYFLSANHCIDGTYDAITNPDLSGAVFYWNYERPGCANTGNVPNETTAGATLVANPSVTSDQDASDFALFRLTEDPSDVYDVYAAGFDASGSPGNTGVGIHHPGLDAKKIATHSIVPTSVVNDNYWRIYWDQTPNGHSVTEGGSSGSGLFNSQGLLIGQLFGGFLGGQPNCSDPFDDEGDYGKLSESWNNDGATDARRRLRDWLDPNNTGQTSVGGRFCTIPDYALMSSPTDNTNCGGNTVTYTIEVISKNGYMDDVSLSVDGLPTGATSGFSTNPVTPGNTTTLTISNLNAVADGDYNFTVDGTSTSSDQTITLGLAVADPVAATLLTPANGSTDVSTFPNLTWQAASGASSYDVEVASDAGFSNVVASANVSNPSWVVNPPLNILTTYYWRVRNVRPCGNDPWSNGFSFTTGDANPGTCGKPIELVCGGTFSGNNGTGEDNFQQHDVGGPNSWTGPELIFEFEADAGDIQVQITGLTADLDLYLYTVCNDPAGSELDESESTSSVETVNFTSTEVGTYFIMVDGFSGAVSDFDLTLTCTPVASSCDDQLGMPTLNSPADNATDVGLTPTLTWMGNNEAESYDVEVASDVSFSNIVASTNVSTTSWTVSPALMGSTTYYWRVRYVRTCGKDDWSDAFAFTTLVLPVTCNTAMSTDIPVLIPPQTTISSTIEITDVSGSIDDINVSFIGTHDRIRDLTFELQSPNGTRIQLIDLDDPCNGRQDDFDFGFDDESMLATIPCPPTTGLLYQPEQALSAFAGEEINGTWTLFVTDVRNSRSGQLDGWQLDYCVLTEVTCATDLVINDEPIAENTYSASNTITSTGTVEAGTMVVFEAGQSITLSPDFSAANSSTFIARIQDCTPATVAAPEVEQRSIISENAIHVYPNPFSQQTTIEVQLATPSEVSIRLFNLTGKQVRQIVDNQFYEAGKQQMILDANALSTGIYWLMINIGETTEMRKLSVIK